MRVHITRLIAAARHATLAFVATLAALLPFAGSAAAEPAMWVVKDAGTTVYLFGTVHLLKPDMQWRSDKIAAALKSSDALWLELAEGGKGGLSQAALWKYGKDPAHPLSTKLTPDEQQKLRAAAQRVGIPPVSLESLRPWLAAITLGSAPLHHVGYDSALGVDNQLLADAKAAGKPVNGLETAEQQLQFFATMSPEMELAMLHQIIADQAEAPDQLDRISGAWLAGDVDKLGALLQAETVSKDDHIFYQRLLIDRNANWAQQITALMQKGGTHFIAVGAAHLAGHDSLQSLLQKRGLTVARY